MHHLAGLLLVVLAGMGVSSQGAPTCSSGSLITMFLLNTSFAASPEGSAVFTLGPAFANCLKCAFSAYGYTAAPWPTANTPNINSTSYFAISLNAAPYSSLAVVGLVHSAPAGPNRVIIGYSINGGAIITEGNTSDIVSRSNHTPTPILHALPGAAGAANVTIYLFAYKAMIASGTFGVAQLGVCGTVATDRAALLSTGAVIGMALGAVFVMITMLILGWKRYKASHSQHGYNEINSTNERAEDPNYYNLNGNRVN
eukprot:m.7326 g.7326  ORF g.7326 m.7326 type:complete len:256 (+) comp2182_c0_seq1:3-770(+)